MSATPTIVEQWSDGKRLHVTGTVVLAGTYVIGGEAIDFGAAGVRSSVPPAWVQFTPIRQWKFNYYPGSTIADGRIVPILLSAQAATGTITSDGTNVSNNDTIQVGATTYTFKTTLTGAANEIQIGVDATTTMQNLIKAVNAEPGFSAVAWGAGTIPNATELAAPIDSTGLIVTVVARKGGTGSNSDSLVKSAAHLSVSGATLASGAAVNANPGEIAAATYPTDLLVLPIPFYAIFDQFI